MHEVARRADEILRGRSWAVETGRARQAIGWLTLCVVLFGMAYGAVMGAYGGLAGDRLLQVLYSALKVPFMLMATGALSLPCFFVLYTLCGLRDDFPAAVRALMAAQAGLAIVLASLAPFTAWWYASCADYNLAILFNGAMFAVASLSAQVLLRHYYRHLIERDPRHRLLVRAWLGIYIFVGIQMGWVLRPFVGDPNRPAQFFRAESWGNAYEVVFRLVWQYLSR